MANRFTKKEKFINLVEHLVDLNTYGGATISYVELLKKIEALYRQRLNFNPGQLNKLERLYITLIGVHRSGNQTVDDVNSQVVDFLDRMVNVQLPNNSDIDFEFG